MAFIGTGTVNKINDKCKSHKKVILGENLSSFIKKSISWVEIFLHTEKEHFANKRDQSNKSDTDVNQYFETMTNSSKSKTHIKIKKRKTLNAGMSLKTNDVTKFDQLYKLIINMFPKSNMVKHLKLENEDGNIPKGKSELRIIAIFVFIASILCLVTLWQVVLITIKIQNPTYIEPLIPKENRPFCKSFALINGPKHDMNNFS